MSQWYYRSFVHLYLPSLSRNLLYFGKHPPTTLSHLPTTPDWPIMGSQKIKILKRSGSRDLYSLVALVAKCISAATQEMFSCVLANSVKQRHLEYTGILYWLMNSAP